MENKGGKKKRSSSSSNISQYSPALPALIEDLRPWGTGPKWKDPALGDVRLSRPDACAPCLSLCVPSKPLCSGGDAQHRCSRVAQLHGGGPVLLRLARDGVSTAALLCNLVDGVYVTLSCRDAVREEAVLTGHEQL